MSIAILQYNAGNTASVRNALQRLGVEPMITDDPETLRSADKVIFPGVGEAGSALRYLRDKGLDELLPSLVQPVLGICLGMQLLCRRSEEGDTTGLGVFDVDVKSFPATGVVPHVGWNQVADLRGPLFDGVQADEHFYFVHGYYAETSSETVAACHYLLPFSAALQRGNFYGVQFHPEKSGAVGSRVLQNFLELSV